MNNDIRKILIFRIGQLGDTIVALPSMHVIRQYFPNAHITLLSDRHQDKAYVFAKDLLANTNLFDDFISFEANSEGVSLRKMIALLPELRRRNFDLLVYLAPRIRSKLQVWRDLSFFRATGIKNFIGHHGITPLPRKNSNEPLQSVEHEADHLLSRLNKSGIPVPDPGEGCIDLQLSAEENQKAGQFINSHVSSGNKPLLVGFGPGSKWPSKIWPKERYAETGNQLIFRYDILPVVFGSAEDKQLGDWLIMQWGRGINAAGVLNVREAAAGLKHCRLYVGNDTGTMHLATAVGIPCVAVFSSMDWPGRWYHYSKQQIVLRCALPCEGCLISTCPKEMDCLNQITVVEVLNACNSFFTNSSHSNCHSDTLCAE